MISPECLACAWIVSLIQEEIEIVPSNNTNLSLSGKLPVLITDSQQYEGFLPVSTFLSTFSGEDDFIGALKLSKKDQLFNRALITYIDNKLRYLTQYNLYISPMNYEKYTRKLFKYYLPFPMMYNQPLKFYNSAQEEVKIIGIGKPTKGLFNFASDNIDDDSIDTTTPISKLHERTILAKNKQRLSVRESRNALRAMNLMNEYVKEIIEFYQESNQGFQLIAGKFTSSELLMLAYLNTNYHESLPNQLLHQTIKSNHPNFYEFSKQAIDNLNERLITLTNPKSHQLPTLFNEIKYQLGY